ncbi:MAG: hypothetical protein WDN75_09915 [Bacteroidota bacterium]
MHDKLRKLQELLGRVDIGTRVVKYEFFDVDLMPELRDNGLF